MDYKYITCLESEYEDVLNQWYSQGYYLADMKIVAGSSPRKHSCTLVKGYNPGGIITVVDEEIYYDSSTSQVYGYEEE